jgi:DNA-binding response OmpR family regulator
MNEARSATPDLILLDLMLPDMMGTEVCKLLKASEHMYGIPVIMLMTAKGEEIDQVDESRNCNRCGIGRNLHREHIVQAHGAAEFL